MVLVADFTASPRQIDYDALTAEVLFTTTIQNILEIAAVTVAAVVSSLPPVVIVVIVVVATTDAAAAAVAITANRVSKVSDQRQLR